VAYKFGIIPADLLTRLNQKDWKSLSNTIDQKQLKIVSQDLPTSHQALLVDDADAMTQGILDAVNGMLIEIMAVMSARDYEMRRARAKQGMLKAKKLGKLSGRPVNQKHNDGIKQMLRSGCTYSQITSATGASRVTISKLKKELLVI